jgi:hypothetical protein
MSAGKSEQICLLSRLIGNNESKRELSTVDLGGGVGHLADSLHTYFSGTTRVLERSREFVKKGQQIYPNITFDIYTIRDDDSFDTIYPAGEYLLTGLHTCSSFGVQLAMMYARSSARFPAFYQVPCCYQTID